eukprot:SAG31_NODE_800_length_12014_cov_11.050608_5_plen_257_part_00
MHYIPVPAVPAPENVDDFERHYLSRPDVGPVLFTESAEVRGWPAMGWTLESLADKIGKTQVHVRSRTSTQEYREGKRYCIEQMSFSKYAALLLAEDQKKPQIAKRPAPDYYLAIQNVLRNFQELKAELPLPSYVRKKHSGPFMWIASAGHYEFAHFDPDDNFLIPIRGKKRVRMWSAADFQRMYPNPLGSKGRTVQFEVDSEKPDFTRHPRAAGPWTGGGPWEVVVEPGQLLFIPAFTIHQVGLRGQNTFALAKPL